MKKKIAVGLSGGVDSAAAAVLLLEQGCQVTGVYFDCFPTSGCGPDEGRKDALKVALKLKIPFKVLDLQKQYRETVLDYFFDEFERGRTPNPDVICNRDIKFGLFYDWALKKGFDHVATGHYVKIGRWEGADGRGQNCLAIPKDKDKDQTYFLYRLRAEQLPKLLFPLADLTKQEVRKIAKEKGLPVYGKRDSTGICLVGDINVRKFLKSRLGEREGEVVGTDGKVVGRHKGHWFFTIGQRHGWEKLDKNRSSFTPRFYVLKKDKKKNQIVVGTKQEAMAEELLVKDMSWQVASNKWQVASNRNGKEKKKRLLVRIRHRGKLISCQLLVVSDKKFKVKLAEPIFGIAPGQSAVIYAKADLKNPKSEIIVLGGGIIV